MTAPQYPREVFGAIPALAGADEHTRRTYTTIFDTVFFASLMAEEGSTVAIGVVVDLDHTLEHVRDTDRYSGHDDLNRPGFSGDSIT